MRVLMLAAAIALFACGGGGGADRDAGPSDGDGGNNPGIDAGAGVLPSDPFYDLAAIIDVRLTVAPADLTTLDANPFARVYVPATFEAMGQIVPNVGIRYKGNSSLARAGNKSSFKIKMNEYSPEQRFLGLTKVNLNNTVLDPSMQREVLPFEMMRDFGVPASRANYARLFVNDELYGLYVNVEQVDKRMLSRTFGDNDGNLYKQYAGASLEYRGPNAAAYDNGIYEKKTNEIENQWADLIGLCELLETDDLVALEAQLPQVLDTSRFLRWLAVNTYLGHIDAYTGFANNYYLYNNPTTSLLTYIPWDLDITFGTSGHGGTTDQFLLNWDLYDPQVPNPTSPRPLLTKMMLIPSFRSEYTGYLAELVDGGELQGALVSRIDVVRSLIQEAARADPRKPYSNVEFDSSLTTSVAPPNSQDAVIGIKAFVDMRTPIVASQVP